MFNLHQDQAAGLRKLMAEPKPRIVSVLSALGDHSTQHAESARLLSQLASSLGVAGYQTHVTYAAAHDPDSLKQYGLLHTPALNHVLIANMPLLNAIQDSKVGYTSSYISSNLMPREVSGQLNESLRHIAQLHDIVLVQTTLTDSRQLPLPLLNDGMIVVQMSQKPASIKQAYRLIKQLYGSLGKKPFGILVHGISAEAAECVFKNIDGVARQFLGIKLDYLGHIPSDERLLQASHMGRSVVDAFPTARISKALKSLASRLLGQARQAV